MYSIKLIFIKDIPANNRINITNRIIFSYLLSSSVVHNLIKPPHTTFILLIELLILFSLFHNND